MDTQTGPKRDVVVDSQGTVTAAEYINSQLELEQEAREVLPYSFDKCTYSMGPLRQPIYSCRDHNDSALCYSCSISCHSECDLVEIFGKRNVQCDCGTTRMPDFKCTLRKVANEKPTETNFYCHNYSGRFCSCDILYDPEKDKGTMYQCLLGDACNEDWFHDSCIMGLGPPKYDDATGEKDVEKKDEDKEDKKDGEIEEKENADQEEEADSPHIPGFPKEDDFEHFICWRCVEKNPWLKGYAGAPGFLQGVVRKQVGVSETTEEKGEVVEAPRGEKRKASEEIGDVSSPKRQRATPEANEEVTTTTITTTATEETVSSTVTESKEVITATTTATTVSISESHTISEAVPCKLPKSTLSEKEQVSLFLTAPFRSHLCRCKDCLPRLSKFRVLLEEEESYSPPMSEADPEDGNSSSHSLLERGERALNTLDRVKAIEGVMAYNFMKEKVKTFLRPFAAEGKQVSAEDVRKYFEALRGDNQPAVQGGEAANGDNRREQSGY